MLHIGIVLLASLVFVPAYLACSLFILAMVSMAYDAPREKFSRKAIALRAVVVFAIFAVWLGLAVAYVWWAVWFLG